MHFKALKITRIYIIFETYVIMYVEIYFNMLKRFILCPFIRVFEYAYCILLNILVIYYYTYDILCKWRVKYIYIYVYIFIWQHVLVTASFIFHYILFMAPGLYMVREYVLIFSRTFTLDICAENMMVFILSSDIFIT